MLGATLCPLLLLLAMLRSMLASGLDTESSFVQVVFPEKVEDSTSSEEQVTYIIPIDKKKYTVRLQKSYFLADRFMVYSYNKGFVTTQSLDIPSQCYYQGYIEDYPNSIATLSTCSGLRGILQFENVSYGIEPLESTVRLQHIIYKLENEGDDDLSVFNTNSRNIQIPQNYDILINEKSESPLKQLFPLYLEMTIVVDKALYDYLGYDSMIVTNKIIDIISLINSVFSQLKVTVVLSSLELWSDRNRISTVGEADELLHRFLEWKKSYLTLRPHDIAYLFVYNEYPNYVGATYPGKMCMEQYSAGITMYPQNMTLEAFSVVVTQMLGLSLGISYDDPAKCHCPETVCIMTPTAVQSTGMKVFSNCSLSDFEHFISNVGAKCLQNKPQMQTSPRPVCGNGRVEGNEICDCGTEQVSCYLHIKKPMNEVISFVENGCDWRLSYEVNTDGLRKTNTTHVLSYVVPTVYQCGPNSCCEPTTCVLKQGNACDSMSPSQTCCQDCNFVEQNQECRPPKHPDCDIAEVCNGSSGACPPDITIHNGHTCKAGGFICFDGDCPDMDKRCEAIYGEGSRNAPFSCYEEIQGQTDRFGNCGKDRQNRYIFCGWRNLICGRLICTYPKQTPYSPPNSSTASVIYAFVRDQVCISVDFGSSVREDPLRVISGSVCDLDRICLNNICVETRFLKNQSSTCSSKCNGKGVCNSLGECHCNEGYGPPDCSTSVRSSWWFNKNDLTMEGSPKNSEKKWLLSLYIALIIFTSTVLVLTVWKGLKPWLFKEEESLSSETKSESNTHTYTSRTKSQTSSGTPTNSY